MKALEKIQNVAELVKFYEDQKSWSKEKAISFLDKKYELYEKLGFEGFEGFEGFDDDGFGDWREFSWCGGDTFWDNLPDSWKEWIGGDIYNEKFIAASGAKWGGGVYNERALDAFLRRYGLGLDDGKIYELCDSELKWDESRYQYRKKRKKAGLLQ